ncbi:MAG: hypothetical protein EZS28_010828 [Streblomastix strix]|uniref:Uncharacterized protein n=1 Tax=Streblomastix strix TaxID=222440 RepID=A0A5J4WGI6_9EUKA|nr:MAG: hypothetical protein EZS28_010828 [Streblomastix strix]
MESFQRNSKNGTKEAITSPSRSIQHEKIDKDKNRIFSVTNCKINKETKISKAAILRSFTLPKHDGLSERLSNKTGSLEFYSDNEQNGNPRYNLMNSKTQSAHSSIVNSDTTTNDNDNGCSTKQMRFNIRERI